MKNQNQIIISIGSNTGDRRNYAKQSIRLIHERVATVVKVSKVYETPAWGFESEAFLNLAILVHTTKSPAKVLKELLKIEKELGRVRQEGAGYQARTIDLDIIAANEDIITTHDLTVPHPQMQNRKFVLLPFRDIDSQWKHPVLKKTAGELLQETQDDSDCVVFQERLGSPLATLGIEQYNYIAIEGNIGAGKTTLATKLSEDCNAKLVLERFADNPFLPKFYKDQNRYAFPLEMSFLADRYQQLTDDLAQFDLFKDFIVADYHIFKSLIFAKVTLQEDEYRLYKTMFDIIHKEMPKPDLYVYLYQNTDRLLGNIKKRGRSYEQEIPSEYLEKINRGYLDYIKTQTDLNVLILDVTDLDFVKKQEDYVFILDQIHKKTKEG
ncbi:2-amino-4-hydroxy-6-hydroxymethyldihydropteridine diphosphokinase [Flavobacterium sp. NRK F10]|uniref:2-amino-4-hydroxy-6- hydroxymethyldihydropteridine diphosphokinase n=1 Tax=Flavobacterium sp. NRK F10 TaxID=2954931 RepID=UPI002091D3D1|nr:2-amino-4-hydroxy-6-hydroxymethyldihydropteridine diphosphokinase [Flavobacterium sp. NRK F10]MCO6175203.1 2-amino-4-hydroxy-6-hydroxymethyldihydropteridine diphosphokinase [Flavobacterium sp. NRK F10]